jgi:hypothetical protein
MDKQPEEVRILTEPEMQRIEQLARTTKLADMLTVFESLPPKFIVPRKLLLGSNSDALIYLKGFTTRHRAIEPFRNLDEPYDSTVRFERVLLLKEREMTLGVNRTIHEELRKGFAKVCMAESMGNCSGKIIRAHSLQKAAFKPSSKQGHVYMFEPFRTNGYEPEPQLVGVNEATAFPGFCDYHDCRLFAPIETEPFSYEPRQIFLHHYRALCQALYVRLHMHPFESRIMVKHHKEVGEPAVREWKERVFLNQVSVNELEAHKAFCEEQITAENWGAIEGVAWTGACAPDVFAGDYFGPGKDLVGNMLQNRKTFGHVDWISLTITASNDKALIILAAEKGSRMLKKFARSFDSLNRNLQTMAFVNLVVCQLENFIMVPSWWDSLAEEHRETICNAFVARYHPRRLPPVCEWGLSGMKFI